MFPQNRSGKPFSSALTLALFLTVTAAWVRSLPAAETSLPPSLDTLEPAAMPDVIPTAEPIETTPLVPLPQPALMKAANDRVAAPVLSAVDGLIPKAEAAPARPGIPVRLSIKGTTIDYPVIDLGLLPDGKLDAPKDGKTLGWYRLGPKPGQKGNSVIDGHLTTVEGPGAFWNLKHVKPGDLIAVTEDQGVTRRFKVRKTAVYHVNHAPMQEIFGAAPGKHLNLITCAGVWDTAMDHYDRRLVVYSDLVE